MKNRKTYSEIMRSRDTKKFKTPRESILDIYIQMIIDESLFKRKKELLETKVNEAIDTRNEGLFMKASAEYRKLFSKTL
ncbi:IDEAL domain-containing protein [Fredinandcohnia sp. QZ13]|uniref:IDEAL domain-containing protein n=1 Tax=Fredinandcohnia sp. QZ13 TaxID=3073144 RepID=UPI0028532F85|nr:IDEAL domain-containing protein [Fredinandcohnia sp. QZ13]MDR4887136.1 IDEAL domain-containing protein [Fredinandcohnia sp. QZ13]